MRKDPPMLEVVDGRPGPGTSRAPERVPSVTLACTIGDPPDMPVIRVYLIKGVSGGFSSRSQRPGTGR